MNNPTEPATTRQTWAIFTMAKYDVRNANLTKEQASYIIDMLKKDLPAAILAIQQLDGAVKKGEPAKPKQDWQAIFNEAHTAGLKAGQDSEPEPMIVNEHKVPPILGPTPIVRQYVVNDGVCGFAWVEFDGRSSFIKWAVENKLARGNKIWVHEFNQSLTRKEAYAHAFAEVLNKRGVACYPQSRID